MTKAEAITALSEGEKITHYYFDNNEWVKESNGMYLFEDGVKQNISEFWETRKLNGWDQGWEIFGDD